MSSDEDTSDGFYLGLHALEQAKAEAERGVLLIHVLALNTELSSLLWTLQCWVVPVSVCFAKKNTACSWDVMILLDSLRLSNPGILVLYLNWTRVNFVSVKEIVAFRL